MLFPMSRLLLNHLSLFGRGTNDGDMHVINPKTSRFKSRLLFSMVAEALLDPSFPCIACPIFHEVDIPRDEGA